MDWTEYDVFLKYRYWLGKYIPKNMQDEAKEYFMTCEEEMLPHILDYDNATNWDCAITILYDIGYPKNKKAVGSVMYVLRDINLPITEIAFKIISENYKQDKTHVIKEMEAVINKAVQIKDPDWLWGICCVVEKLELQQNDFSSNEFWKLLSTCGYWNE